MMKRRAERHVLYLQVEHTYGNAIPSQALSIRHSYGSMTDLLTDQTARNISHFINKQETRCIPYAVSEIFDVYTVIIMTLN